MSMLNRDMFPYLTFILRALFIIGFLLQDLTLIHLHIKIYQREICAKNL